MSNISTPAIWRNVLAATAVAMLAAACSPTIQEWRDHARIEKTNTIEWSVAKHELRFAPGTYKLTDDERVRFGQFLAEFDLRRPAHVYVSGRSKAAPSTLAEKRAATVAALLRAHGVTPRLDPPKAPEGTHLSSTPSDSNDVVVLIGYFDVMTPGCPDWRKPTNADYTNMPSSNFGCANAMNLAAMVADPRDLVRGEDEGLADGRRAAKAVNEYWAGKQPTLPKEGPNAVPKSIGGGK